MKLRRWRPIVVVLLSALGCAPINVDPDPSDLPSEFLFLYQQHLVNAHGFQTFASKAHEMKAVDVWYDNCNIDVFPQIGNAGRLLRPIGHDGSGNSVSLADTFFAGTHPSFDPVNWNLLNGLKELDSFGRGINNFTTNQILWPGCHHRS